MQADAPLTPALINQLTTELGIYTEESTEVSAEMVKRNTQLAQTLGLMSTPSYLIGPTYAKDGSIPPIQQLSFHTGTISKKTLTDSVKQAQKKP